MGVPVELVGMTYADLLNAFQHGQDIFVRREGDMLVASVEAVAFRKFVYRDSGIHVECLVVVSVDENIHVGIYTLPRGDYRLLFRMPS